MKINVFKIPIENFESLRKKIDLLSMVEKYKNMTPDGWSCHFYLSSEPDIKDIAWVQDYSVLISDIKNIENVVYFAIYLCVKDDNCFALTYGKSHFYARKFCDSDFGLEMAKRIANENDIKQKAIKRFSGRKKKEIKSYVKNTVLLGKNTPVRRLFPDKPLRF